MWTLRRLTFLLVPVLLLPGCAVNDDGDGGPADPGGPDGDTFTPDVDPTSFTGLRGTAHACSEAGVILQAAAADVAPFVADGFTPATDATGRVPVTVLLLRCDDLLLDDGRSTGAWWQSEASIQVESPDGSGGSHWYDLWVLTDNPILGAALEGVDYRGGRVTQYAEGEGSGSAAGPLVEWAVYGHVPWDEGDYEISVEARGPADIPWDPSAWWHGTDTGNYRIVYTIPTMTAHAGTGSISANGILADIVGDAAAGPGLFMQFDELGIDMAPVDV